MPMKKLYHLLLIVFFSAKISAQTIPVSVEKIALPDTRFQFINVKTGVAVNGSEWDEADPFMNGFAKVYGNGKWGFVDGNGNQVVPPLYETVRNFRNHLAAVRKNWKWGFINEKGVVVIPFEYDIAYDFDERVSAGYKDRKWFLIDRSGKIIRALGIDIFWGFKHGLAKITSKGQSATMNLNGDIVATGPVEAVPLKPTKVHAPKPTATPAQVNVCPANIDFEFGNFTNWNCDTGSVGSVGTTNVITVIPSPPTPNRQVLIPTVVPSALDPYGLFPTNSPNGSNFALRLGNNINGKRAERITYQITVPANAVDFYISYDYAVVFQDPGHKPYQQPRFQAQVLDVATNTYLPCASYEYVSGSGLPGFFDSPLDSSVKCKAWSTAFINLSAYAGKVLILEFTAADCTLGAHWGYAYLDVDGCNIAATAQYSCNPSQAVFTSPPGFQYYNWYSNNYGSLLGSGQNMVLTSPPVPGSTLHVVLVPYNGFGCSDTLSVPYTANLPAANAGPDVSACAGKPVSIGASPVGGYRYSWTPSTFLSNPNASNPVADPPIGTTYIVTATDTVSGCTAEDTVLVNINARPVAGFNPVSTQCLAGNSFNFVNTSNVSSGTLTYLWSFGDGAVSTNANPVHSYSNSGTYNVKLVVTSSNGCMDSVIHTAVTVNGNPVVKTASDRSICRGSSVQLPTTGAQTYSWAPSGGLSCSNCSAPSASPDSSATYFVKGLDSLGCPGYDSVHITVFQPIAIQVSAGRAICKHQTDTLLASGGAVSYIWSPAQSLSNPNIANPVASPDTTTLYRVIGFDGHHCFSDTGYITVSLNPQPVAAFNPGAAQCLAGNRFIFTDSSSVSSGNLTFRWSFGDSTFSVSADPVHTFGRAGVYSVKLVVTSNEGCMDSVVHPAVTVNGNPPVKATADLLICRGSHSQLQATGALTYAWSPPAGLSCISCSNPVASPTGAATYFVKGVDVNGCPGFDTVTITVFQPIKINVSPDVAICALHTVGLQAGGDAVSYAWSPAQTLSSDTIPDPVASPNVTTQYRVIGYDGHHCFTDTGYINVTVNPNPLVNAGPDLNLSKGTVYQLNPVVQNGPIVSWLWTPSNNLSCSNCPNPSVTVENNISYDVIVTNVYGCTAEDTINISTFCQGSQVFIPNAFTPDGDGINDILMVRATGIQSVLSFRIFSRWGELLFEKTNFPPNNPSYGWDGKIKGAVGPAEVYVYVAEVVCDNMQTYTFKGNVTLLK